MSNINLSVNGQQYSLESVAGETLSTLLRQRLQLTGTKIGCEEAECGACTVLVDGEPICPVFIPLSARMEDDLSPLKDLPSTS